MLKLNEAVSKRLEQLLNESGILILSVRYFFIGPYPYMRGNAWCIICNNIITINHGYARGICDKIFTNQIRDEVKTHIFMSSSVVLIWDEPKFYH